MKKDNTRDYVISMFRFYAKQGQPNRNQIIENQSELSSAAVSDLIAVDETLRELSSSGNGRAVLAVKEIYFKNPTKPLSRKEFTERVTHFTLEHYISEDVVWKSLRKARRLCAEKRNLNISKFI